MPTLTSKKIPNLRVFVDDGSVSLFSNEVDTMYATNQKNKTEERKEPNHAFRSVAVMTEFRWEVKEKA